MELAARARLADSREVYLACTRNDSRYAGIGGDVAPAVGDIAGNRLTGVPGDMLVVSVGWRRGWEGHGPSR